MNKSRKTIKKVLIGLSIAIVVFVVLIIAFISPIAKYLIEKYDEKFTGRQITLGWVYLNPFTGYAHLHNLKIYEYKSDSVFFASQGISANFEMLKLLSKTYEISSLTINKPYAVIVQDHAHFNFSDLIERFKPKEAPDTTKPPVHFNLLDVELTGGEFHYIESSIPINYFIKDVKLKTPGMRWDVDTVNAEYYIANGPGSGSIEGKAVFNLKNTDYGVAVLIKNFELGIFQQYLRDISTYGTFTAFLDADLQAKGNVSRKLDLTAKGFLAVNDFHFGKRKGDDYLSFDRLAIDMTEVSPKDFKYVLDSFMLAKPYFKFERYDYLDNVQRMFGKGGEKYTEVKGDATKFNLIIEIAKYVQELAKNFLQSYYKVGKVAIYNGNIVYNDFALREKFTIAANPLYILADSIDKNYKWMNLKLGTGMDPYGHLGVKVQINPNNYGDFSIKYDLDKVSLPTFNPYLVTYTSFPLDRGMLEAHGNWLVRDNQISSDNHLLVIDARTAKRVKKKDTKWIPTPLILSIVRPPSNVIDFEIPIRGNLNDPKFVLWDVIWDVLTNLFVKPPLTPYLAHTKQVESQVEKFLTLKWETRQTGLRMRQEKFVERIADFLKETQESNIRVEPMIFQDKEKESVLLFEAKKKYFLKDRKDKSLSEDDSIFVDKMSVKDAGFVAYLDKLVKDTLLFTVQEKALFVVGDDKVDAGYSRLSKERRKIFLSYFDSAVIAQQVKIDKEEYGVPFNGFSYYRIRYKGELPKKLQKAYDEMQEINTENPRGKYKNERKKNRAVLRKTI